MQLSELKSETGGQQPFGNGLLPAQQQPGQFAQQDLQGQCRHRHERRAVQHLAQGLGKFAVTHRVWRAGIIRTAGVFLVQKKINQGDLIFDMHPRHPLPTIADRPAQRQFERQQQARQKAALGRQHQPRTHQHHANAQGFGTLGGPIGNGRQWMPWVHIKDQIALIDFLLHKQDANGPYNACAPHPVRNREFAKTLGQVLHRPAFMPMPAFALKVGLGELSGLLLGGQKALPERLQAAGFTFQFTELRAALDDLSSRL